MHTCAFMLYWAGLFKPDFAGGVTEGIKVLLAIAQRVLVQQRNVLVVQMLPALHDDQAGDDVEA